MTISAPPPFQRQLNPDDPLGSESCVAYAFAMAIAAATGGAKHPTGEQVRDLTGDMNGGLELAQCAVVAQRDYGLPVSTGVFSREVYEARMATGRFVSVLIGGYRPIGATRFSGQPGGVFNHAVTELPRLVVMDPLADGRRPGVYKFHGEAYPQELVRQFAANLRLSDGSVAGDNHFEASLFALPLPVPIHPHVRLVTGAFRTYTVHTNGGLHAVGSSVFHGPPNSTIPCSEREYPVRVASSVPIPMRQLGDGQHKGLWVIAHGALAFSN